MTTLGMVLTGRANGKTTPQPLDLVSLVASLVAAYPIDPTFGGNPHGLAASLQAWTDQDEDAHEPCSLTACRAPLHPGPCKGWKGTLHMVSPGTYHQVEAERVRKANDRRMKRIADLKSQGKPIPRKLLTEIKAKPAPAHSMTAQPLGQVNQKADLAGGQAHHAGAAVTKAAGVKVSTAPLPLGPKGKKPAVAGRGPAFVITQPKVTDQYKLDKAAKITPQEWDNLTPADKATIRNELTAIKARGFGPQQTKADALLAKLPAANTVGNTAGQFKPAGHVTTPSGQKVQVLNPVATPGKVSLGQATKAVPSTPTRATYSPQQDAVTNALASGVHSKVVAATSALTRKEHDTLDQVQRGALKVTLEHIASGSPDPKAKGRARLLLDAIAAKDTQTEKDWKQAGTGEPTLAQIAQGEASRKAATPATPQLPAPAPSPKLGTRDQNGILNKPLPGGSVSSTSVGLPSGYRITRDGMGYSLKHNGKLIRTSATQSALEQYAKDHAKVQLGHVPSAAPAAPGVPGTPPTPAKAAPASSPGIKPSAPLAPGTAAHIQHANAVANRTAPRAVQSKAQVDAYGKLSKADFDALPADTQKTIRDDLANARAKFLDPKKQQAAKDLLDRFGSRHPAPAAPAALPAAHQQTLEKIASGAKVVNIGNGHTNPGLAELDKKGLVAWDPSAKQFKVTDAGKAHLATKTAPSPAAPAAKGYSDPMNQAVKAAQGADVDEMLKRVGQLSHASIGNLTDADRKQILSHLNYVSTRHAAQAPKTAAKAAALKRIIEAGKPQGGAPLDHEPSINELHAEEQKNAPALAVTNALKAADVKGGTPLERADRLRDLGALSKAQFDALPKDDKDKITSALHTLHADRKDAANGITNLDPTAAAALEKYTGLHPGIHRLRTAEAAFRAGDIDADRLWQEFLHARVQSPSKMNDPTSPGAVLAEEAQRVAVDNPKLPHWLRATLIDNPYSGYSGTYVSIARAQNRYDYEDAPRLSNSDITDIFRATEAELANSHPVHAEAVKALREHVLLTGLAPNSPWSTATKNHVADNLLHISYSNPEIPTERLKEYEGLSATARARVERVMHRRLLEQTNDHAKTKTYIALRELQGQGKASPDVHAALLAASGNFPSPSSLDTYRKLDKADYDTLPPYVQKAIGANLDDLQKRAEQRSGGNDVWSPTDNPFKVMPGTLKDHLDGMRTAYPDRNVRAASDIANYGEKIYAPYSRVAVYGDVTIGKFHGMPQGDQDLIHNDLEHIAGTVGVPLATRYRARLTRDIALDNTRTINVQQVVAIGATDPAPSRRAYDSDVVIALNKLDKADYDSLDPVYREAIDLRVGSLPGSDQQLLNAKFHPAAAANNPAGVVPTTGTPAAPLPPHVQAAVDTIYGVHPSGKSHTMAHQLSTYGALRGSDFTQLNAQEQSHLLGDLSFIATTAKGPSADKARKLIDRFTPPGTPAGQVPAQPIIPPANAVAGQVRYATPLVGTLVQATDKGTGGDGWITTPGGKQLWGKYGAAGVLLQHVDPQTGEKRYLMVQRGPAISDPGKWQFPGGAIDSKETFHQGGAREVIEELGFKADAMKAAQVHGEHTSSVPGSTWKYVSIAAQVDQMLKPDLSTHHARAETSDAKWMTEAEIRKLDTDGKLLAPLAGGKLEQNVLSLFPKTPTTLGQIARPGPVTKRLGRLRMPSGGRQAPTSFNAWPHAHKPSKGRNLVTDKASIDKLRQDVKHARKQYDGKTADGRLAAIGATQGFDDTPTVASKKEVDRLLATGDYIEVWRGVKGTAGRWNSSGNGKSAAQINEEMRSGPAYYGTGIFGNGYYLATQKSVATQYSDNTKNSIARILIPKSALTEHYDKVEGEAHAAGTRISKAKGSSSYEPGTLYDPGRYAAAKGIDGIEIQHHHRSGGGWAKHIAKAGQPAYNWINRSVLIVQEAQ